MSCSCRQIITLLILSVLYATHLLASEVTIRVVDKDENPLDGIVVYLVSEDGQYQTETKPRDVTVYQRDKKFAPYITVKSVSDNLIFENQDNITHHIFTVLSKDLSFRLKKNTLVRDKQISQPGKALMGCNIHDWMTGYVFTVDTPYYGKTGQNGKATFEIPSNKKFIAQIWHPQMSEEDNKLSKDILAGKGDIQFKLTQSMEDIPSQENDALFEFLEDY